MQNGTLNLRKSSPGLQTPQHSAHLTRRRSWAQGRETQLPLGPDATASRGASCLSRKGMRTLAPFYVPFSPHGFCNATVS